jgi:hypothetical protein
MEHKVHSPHRVINRIGVPHIAEMEAQTIGAKSDPHRVLFGFIST